MRNGLDGTHDLAIYPGGDLVAKGLDDLYAGTLSEEALLVAEAAPRLRALGFEVPELDVRYPHLALYAQIEARLPRGAHALIDRIVSFANAYRP